MSLTYDDFQQIRAIVYDVVDAAIEPVAGEVIALRNDVKEIYLMINRLEKDIKSIKYVA